MKKVIVKDYVQFIDIKSFKDVEKMIVMYPDNERIYALTRKNTQNTYDLRKSGIRINDPSTRKARDRAVMKLVDYLNIMLPYLCEYYGLR